MHVHKTSTSDDKDTKKKAAVMHALVQNPQMAIRAANEIRKNPQLLDGLGGIVAKLAMCEDAAKILEDVFEVHAKTYPRTYAAFVRARF